MVVFVYLVLCFYSCSGADKLVTACLDFIETSDIDVLLFTTFFLHFMSFKFEFRDNFL